MHRTAFSYYGGKGMHVSSYPEPRHKTIIEPFCGGSAYSLKWYKHNIIINDMSLNVFDVWRFLQQKKSKRWIDKIPKDVEPGDKISDMFDVEKTPNGLIWFLRSACNCGTFGTGKKAHKQMDTITKIAAANWYHNTVEKYCFWNEKIQHWKITHGSYEKIKNIKATWFIDPPYNNIAGSRYVCNKINYDQLAKYCKSRKGQTIVCENDGADWLAFKKIKEFTGFNCKHIKSRNAEVFYNT